MEGIWMQVTFHRDVEQYGGLRKAAQKAEMEVSSLVRNLICRYLDQEEKASEKREASLDISAT